MLRGCRYMSSNVTFERLSACVASKSERVDAYTHPALRAIRGVTVSRYFREAALRDFRVLRESKPYWLLFCYLLFGSWIDEDTRRLLLCAEILSEIEGRDPDNSEAEKFLIRFRDEVLRPTGGEIQWTGWYEGKCRQLWKRHFGQKFEEILRREHFGYWDDSGLVNLLDGSAYNRSNARHFRREQRQAAGRLPTLCEHAESIRTYMNTL